MTAKSENTAPDRTDPQRLRDICWELGASFPSRLSGTRILLTASHPRLGYASWNVEQGVIDALQSRLGERFWGARYVVRVYDVTDVIFDGHNSQAFFDIAVAGLSGNYYVPIPHTERNLLAEIGFVLVDGSFHALARSLPRWFDRDRPTSNFQLGGLFVSSNFEHVIAVESVLDAPVFERLSAELLHVPGGRALRVATLDAGLGAHLTALVRRLGGALTRLDTDVTVFVDDSAAGTSQDVVAQAQRRSAGLFASLRVAHEKAPFDLVHCHEWYSVPAALRARELGIPLLVSLHSTEFERTGGNIASATSQAICDWERQGTAAASLVIVPRESTRHVLIEEYGVMPERVTVVPDAEQAQEQGFADPTQAKQELGLDASWPIALFAGELAHATGADLLMDAVETVCRDNPRVHFVFAGEGPLRGELEARAFAIGLGHRCRFLGHVPGDRFEAVLLACDFLVIPARTWQDEGLAQLAISFGKPVLTTRQANLYCVEHGQNGLVTYDNPGSIVWGVKELLANPLRGSMLRLLARQRANHAPSFERMTVEHRIAYGQLLVQGREVAV
jgi:glycosyltransferase involved in cell wall biosynthesis